MLALGNTTAARPCGAAANVARRSRVPLQARQLAVRAQEPQSAQLSAPKRALQASAKIGGALALAAILATSAPDAAEAAKTGGRAGGSSGFSRARSAPAPERRAPPPQVNNYYSSGPSFGFSPFGFSPFGFSPFGYGGGAVVVGAPIGGGFLLNFFLVTLALGVVGRVASSFSGNKKEKERDDQW